MIATAQESAWCSRWQVNFPKLGKKKTKAATDAVSRKRKVPADRSLLGFAIPIIVCL